jgi:hypothetical protein
MARKLRGNTTMDMFNNGMTQRNSFKPIGTTITTTKASESSSNASEDGQIPATLTSTPTSRKVATPSIIGQSYNQMVGQPDSNFSKYAGMLPSTNQFTELPGKDGFYSSMSGLEGASMRLANAASQRSMAEAGYGSGLKMGETAAEYGLRSGILGQEYGLKGEMLGQEYGLKGKVLGQEYGLRGDLAQRESDIQTQSRAQGAGYFSPSEMQFDIRRKRQEQDRRKRQNLR